MYMEQVRLDMDMGKGEGEEPRITPYRSVGPLFTGLDQTNDDSIFGLQDQTNRTNSSAHGLVAAALYFPKRHRNGFGVRRLSSVWASIAPSCPASHLH